jgi:phosphopantothenoylcysteine synthetase/decarboxylase
VSPNAGALADGDVSMGRLAEPPEIAEALLAPKELRGQRVLMTAGLTREHLRNPRVGAWVVIAAERR